VAGESTDSEAADSDLITLSEDDENDSETECVNDDQIVPLPVVTDKEAAAAVEKARKLNEAAFARHAQRMEMQCIQETTMLAHVRSVVPHQVQFIVHGDTSGFLFAFYTHGMPSERGQVLHCVKLPQKECTSGNPTIEMHSLNEDDLEKFQVEHVENDERDFPHVMEMPIPYHLAGEYASNIGNFVGAISFRAMQDVIFDVWRVADGPSWVTTTIDSYVFTVIEHIGIVYSKEDDEEEEEEETINVMQMYGRHCKKGHLLTEAYAVDA
jgi:hypothetical protein